MEDPYDDFNPRDYAYHTDEEADDVVYMENADGAEEGPAWSPLSLQLTQDAHQSQSQQRLPATTLLPRKERKRQRQQNFLCMEGTTSSSSDCSNNDEEDIFATVRSFIEKEQAREETCFHQEARLSQREISKEENVDPAEVLENENRDIQVGRNENRDIQVGRENSTKCGTAEFIAGHDMDAEEEPSAEQATKENFDKRPPDDDDKTFDELPHVSEKENQYASEHQSSKAIVDSTQSGFPWQDSSMSTRLENGLKRQRTKRKQSLMEHKRDVFHGSSALDDVKQSRTMMAEVEKTRRRVQSNAARQQHASLLAGKVRGGKHRSQTASCLQKQTIGSDFTRRTAGSTSLVGSR